MWQCSTIQLDFTLPERFDLDYVAVDGSRQRPIMIHRAIFGSLERFFGIMTENYAGDYPFWLAPEQVRLLPVTDEVQPYAEQLLDQLTNAGVRATCQPSLHPRAHRVPGPACSARRAAVQAGRDARGAHNVWRGGCVDSSV